MDDLRGALTAPPVLWGVRCADIRHHGFGYGRVYAQTEGRHRVARLAESSRCYELVESRDGGITWARAEP